MAGYDENRITFFAQTDSRNKRVPFGIKAKDRTKHVYVIGKTGMGKSTLLENMAIQDIQNGEGMAFIDPHGKSAEYLLDFVPEHRIKDVLYFAPFDMEYPLSFNIMEDIGPDKRHLVVSGLMSTFKKIWIDAWSARMEYILQNTLLALLEYPGATLLGVNKMLSDKEYRKNVVQNIKDPAVKSFWVDEFAKYTDKFAAEATPAIQNKVGQFTSNPLIRNIIGQPKSSFDLRKVLDEKKILIVNLSKGRVGEGNANLLGSMLITKIYLAALSRADMPESVVNKLPNFYLYVDEFQSFANESFADILSEARKYKLNLTMAHQYIEQMSEEVRAAVFGNIGTMITFRVGAFDAEVLEKEFAPQFTAEDLVNLGFTQVYMKLMIDGVSSHPFSATTLPPIEKQSVSFRDSVIVESRRQFGVERQDVEDEIVTQMGSHGAQAPTTHIPQENKSTLANRGIPQGAPNHEPQKKVEGSPISNLRSALASVLTNEELPPLSNHSKQMAVSGGLKENTSQEKNKDGGTPHVSRVNEVPRRDGHLQTHSGNTQRSFGAPHGDKHHTQQSSKPTHGLSHEKGKSLKEALGEILKKMPEKLDENKANQVEPKAMHVSATKEEKVSEERKPHEIPEDELKKMLEVPPQQ